MYDQEFSSLNPLAPGEIDEESDSIPIPSKESTSMKSKSCEAEKLKIPLHFLVENLKINIYRRNSASDKEEYMIDIPAYQLWSEDFSWNERL